MNTNAVNFSVETAKAESRTDEKFLAMNWAQHLQTPGRHRGSKLFFLPSTPGENALGFFFLPKTSACHGIAQHPDPYGGLGYRLHREDKRIHLTLTDLHKDVQTTSSSCNCTHSGIFLLRWAVPSYPWAWLASRTKRLSLLFIKFKDRLMAYLRPFSHFHIK